MVNHVKAKSVVAVLALLALARPLHAEEAPPTAKREVAAAHARLHHAPRAAAPAGEDLALEATIEHAELVQRALIVVVDASGTREIPFQRAASGPYVAVVPAETVRPPGLAYAIELETVAGERVAVIEAMKMENVLFAAADGVVGKVLAGKGESLTVDQPIIEFA